MKKIILLFFIILTIFGCKMARYSLHVRTNTEFIVVDKTKNIEGFHYCYLIADGNDILYNYIDTVNFSVGDTLVLTIKRKYIMEKYILLDALAAEIEKRIKEIEEIGTYLSPKGTLTNLLCYINTLEVKEVDLEKELEDILKKEKAFVTDNREVKYYNGDSFNHIYELEFIAKHFFELGLKAQKGE